MSHTVVRGEPYKSQRYLDGILLEVLQEKGRAATDTEKRLVSLPQILFYCLNKKPSGLFMINGATGEKVTNEEILKQSVAIARVLIAKGMRDKTIILVMRNHQRMTAMYIAALLAGTLPFMVDPSSTFHEMSHFLKLVEPPYVFCDCEHEKVLETVLQGLPTINAKPIVFETEEHLKNFTKGYSDKPEDFIIADVDPTSPVMLLPTSGSTGLPKACIMSQRGLVEQLAVPWAHCTQFPMPTKMMMILTTLQWMTFTMMVTSGVVYQVPVLISPEKTTVDTVKAMLVNYRPSRTFFGPAFLKNLLLSINEDHFSSLDSVTVLGAPSTADLLAAVQEKLPKTARIENAYGTTETQGYIAVPDRLTPATSNGRVANIFQYKMVDEDGKAVGLCQNGELYVKGVACTQGYYKDMQAYHDTFIDGWFQTGDRFYIDEHERLHYVERRKFSFKYRGCHVSPVEVEDVIGSVHGVQECLVCETERGPAAAVVLRPGAAASLVEQKIYDALAALSDHKRLHGGLIFVPSLPHTHSGKLKRTDGQKLIIGHQYQILIK